MSNRLPHVFDRKEADAIRALRRLAENWPSTLMLHVQGDSGSVKVILCSDYSEGNMRHSRSADINNIAGEGGDAEWLD